MVWTAVVLIASTAPFSAEHTGTILAFVISNIFGSIDPSRFALIHFLVRKSAHLTEYGILALFFFRAWRGDHFFNWRFAWARQAWAMCIAVAATDEFHQSFVPTRTASIYDSMIDSAGGLAALVLIAVRGKSARLSKAWDCS